MERRLLCGAAAAEEVTPPWLTEPASVWHAACSDEQRLQMRLHCQGSRSRRVCGMPLAALSSGCKRVALPGLMEPACMRSAACSYERRLQTGCATKAHGAGVCVACRLLL